MTNFEFLQNQNTDIKTVEKMLYHIIRNGKNLSEWLRSDYLPNLEECPFCNKTDSLELILDDNFRWRVICSINKNGCDACGGSAKTKLGAIKNWNKREQDAEVINNETI